MLSLQSPRLLDWFRKPGLLGAMLLSFSAALLLILGLLGFFIPRQVERDLRDLVYNHARSVARELVSAATAEGLATSPLPAGERTLPGRAARILGAGVLTAQPGGTPVIVARIEGGVPGALEEALRSLGSALTEQERELPNGDIVVVRGWDPGGGNRAWAVVRARGVQDELAGVRWTVAGFLVGGFVLLAAISWAVSRTLVVGPLRGMLQSASRLSEADLTGRVEPARGRELDQLSGALNRIGLSLREMLGRVRGVSDAVAAAIEQISRTGNAVSSGASTTQARVDDTSSSMVQMIASIRGIGQNVEVLYQSAEQSSASILQMAATNEEVAQSVDAMAASVDETTSAIEEMTFSIKEVARNIEELLASTEETSSSMNEMDVSISQVETNAYETARLAEQVSQDAASGVESLRNTLAGIDKIRDSSRTAAEVIDSLGRRIEEIGNILNVIDDVAEQTNLLALNAAIIAAQAGEHGKGFAVVADEIKDLAERTGSSTREIADVIRAVQDESRNAVAVMTHGVRNVDEGVRLARDAENALRKITSSADKATVMVKAIARATVEQAKGSKQVTAAIQRIAETVHQISKATNEQARGSEQIMKGSERMKALTAQVKRSSHEQSHGSRQITRSIESINEMVGHLNRAQKEQAQGSERVLQAVEAIKTVADHQTRSVRQLEEAIELLQKQAEVLRSEVRRFRV